MKKIIIILLILINLNIFSSEISLEQKILSNYYFFIDNWRKTYNGQIEHSNKVFLNELLDSFDFIDVYRKYNKSTACYDTNSREAFQQLYCFLKQIKSNECINTEKLFKKLKEIINGKELYYDSTNEILFRQLNQQNLIEISRTEFIYKYKPDIDNEEIFKKEHNQ